MKVGIVGLPNVGKSTLFNALLQSYTAPAENFPFCTIDPNVGIVEVRDQRVDVLASLSQSLKKVYATIEFVDIAGLVQGAHKGEGLGNRFLSHIREVDAIVHVLRYFSDPNVAHIYGTVDPHRDRDIIHTELILADVEYIERFLPAYERKLQSNKDIYLIQEYDVLQKVYRYLQQGLYLYSKNTDFSDQEKQFLRKYNFLTFKPIIYALNVSIHDYHIADSIHKKFSDSFDGPVCVVCAQLEADMVGFSLQEKQEYLRVSFGELDTFPTLDTLIHQAFQAVGLMYYFTTGEKETRAWTIPIGTTARDAAGVIHTDLQKGFIKAEVIDYETLVRCGSWNRAKEKGKIRIEGKDYIIREGDVIFFRSAL